MSSLAVRKAAPAAGTTPATQGPPLSRRIAFVPTLTLLLGALYCLLPVAWVAIAATKSGRELFSTFTFLPGSAPLRLGGGRTAVSSSSPSRTERCAPSTRCRSRPTSMESCRRRCRRSGSPRP